MVSGCVLSLKYPSNTEHRNGEVGGIHVDEFYVPERNRC